MDYRLEVITDILGLPLIPNQDLTRLYIPGEIRIDKENRVSLYSIKDKTQLTTDPMYGKRYLIASSSNKAELPEAFDDLIRQIRGRIATIKSELKDL